MKFYWKKYWLPLELSFTSLARKLGPYVLSKKWKQVLLGGLSRRELIAVAFLTVSSQVGLGISWKIFEKPSVASVPVMTDSTIQLLVQIKQGAAPRFLKGSRYSFQQLECENACLLVDGAVVADFQRSEEPGLLLVNVEGIPSTHQYDVSNGVFRVVGMSSRSEIFISSKPVRGPVQQSASVINY